MLTRRAFTGLVAGGIAGAAGEKTPHAVSATTAQDATPKLSRRREAEELLNFVERTHPDGPAAMQDNRWRSRADSFIASADGLDDAKYPVEAMRLLSWFKDGHTSIYVPELHSAPWNLRLPIGRDIFADGMYVTSAQEDSASLLGAKITHIAGTPIETCIKKFADVWPSAGPVLVHRWSILLLSSPGFLHAFGLMDGPPDAPISIKGIQADGSSVSAMVHPSVDGMRDRKPLRRQLSELETYSSSQNYGKQPNPAENGRNFVRSMDGGRTVYVSLDRMSDDDFSKPFNVFEQELTHVLENRSGRLIVDLRRNGGGDNMLCEPFRRRIARSRFNRPGGLYVLIAPHTFSAAQNLANRLERETFAFFVGEPTGSAPNHCGDATQFKGPVTALPAQVSTVRWMDSSPVDKRATIMPDVLVPLVFADFINGRDRALEVAVTHVDKRPFDDAILSAPWERESQRREWKPFWQ